MIDFRTEGSQFSFASSFFDSNLPYSALRKRQLRALTFFPRLPFEKTRAFRGTAPTSPHGTCSCHPNFNSITPGTAPHHQFQRTRRPPSANVYSRNSKPYRAPGINDNNHTIESSSLRYTRTRRTPSHKRLKDDPACAEQRTCPPPLQLDPSNNATAQPIPRGGGCSLTGFY